MDVAKVNWNVAYIVMIIHVRCKCLFPMFLVFFSEVYLSGCCICFTRMLQVFYLDVAYVCNYFSSVFYLFLHVFQIHVRMFQLFRTYVAIAYLNVSKVDRRCCACCNMSQLLKVPSLVLAN
jgi:hypothetical protein